MNTDTQNHEDENSAAGQARAQLNSVMEMVAALDGLDWDRLIELRGERKDLRDEFDTARTAYTEAGEELAASEICVRHHHNGELDKTGDTVEHQQYRADFEHHKTTADELNAAAKAWSEWEEENAEELAELETIAGECEDQDDAQQRIYDDALSVEVRSDWHEPGADSEPAEFRIVLCTGGPHVEIVGDLDEDGTPDRARLLYQDWGTGKQEYITDEAEQAALITYAAQFLTGQ